VGPSARVGSPREVVRRAGRGVVGDGRAVALGA
jgi:hypothetical protein